MKHKIGIIGGSGALATSFLLQKINEYSVSMYQCSTDSDFLHTVTISTPLTHLDFKGNSKEDTFMHLLNNMHDLESIGCNVIVMACNTVHIYWDKLYHHRKNTQTIVLHLPQIVASFIDCSKKNIGLLCSEQCRQSHLYEKVLHHNEQTIIYPNNHIQESVNDCINSVIRHDNNIYYQDAFNHCLKSLFEKNVDCVILGCTELSLLKTNLNDKKIYDSVELLAIYLNQHFKD